VWVLQSFLVEVNLLPSSGGVNETDTEDISAFNLRSAHIPIIPFLRPYPAHVDDDFRFARISFLWGSLIE